MLVLSISMWANLKHHTNNQLSQEVNLAVKTKLLKRIFPIHHNDLIGIVTRNEVKTVKSAGYCFYFRSEKSHINNHFKIAGRDLKGGTL